MPGSCEIFVCAVCGNVDGENCARCGELAETRTERIYCGNCEAKTRHASVVAPSLSECRGCCECPGPIVTLRYAGGVA